MEMYFNSTLTFQTPSQLWSLITCFIFTTQIPFKRRVKVHFHVILKIKDEIRWKRFAKYHEMNEYIKQKRTITKYLLHSFSFLFLIRSKIKSKLWQTFQTAYIKCIKIWTHSNSVHFMKHMISQSTVWQFDIKFN
jgi:hypothetical protein